MLSLKDFLKTKEIFYKKIDYEYFPALWKRIEHKFRLPKIVHIVGTNGKGSTGRFLAWYLYRAGYKVGHYSSPHILDFSERIWLNGSDANHKLLEAAHQSLYKKLDIEDIKKLSYFEYTTLLAIEVFQNLNFIVLEAGLGGEFDATNVFKKLFSLITPISKDHESFLGDSIKEIATTKLRSVSTFAIMASQIDEVYKVAEKLKIEWYKSEEFFSKAEKDRIKEFIKEKNFASYLEENLILALSAVKKLGIKYDLGFLEGVKLRGRFEKFAKNIIIDVGHNALGAKAIKNELKDKKITLIYNTYKDKDFKKIFEILKDNIKEVLIIDIENERILKREILEEFLKQENIPFKNFLPNMLEPSKEYLVFGSFVVVEKFLKEHKF